MRLEPGFHLVVAADAADLAARAARLCAAAARDAVAARGVFHVALAGGSTPRAMHERWAREPGVPWEAVHVWFGDERCVPEEHPDSNFRMARESLLSRVPIPVENVHRMEAERDDRDVAAREYDDKLPPALDLLVLGMGEDGHTASLFPGAPSLDERVRRVMPVVGPKPPPLRLTVTPPVILAARARIVLAGGAGKAEVLARVLEGPHDARALPAQLARDSTWIVDGSAAQGLSRTILARSHT